MDENSKYPAWEKAKADFKMIAGWVLVMLPILLVSGYVINFGISYAGWVAFTHNVALENVYVPPEPHDCDWDTAPLGSKHCHYKSEVMQTYGQGNHVDDSKIKFAVDWQKIED